MIIDDIAGSSTFSLDYIFKRLAQKKGKRAWVDFLNYLEKKYKAPSAQKMVAELRTESTYKFY